MRLRSVLLFCLATLSLLALGGVASANTTTTLGLTGFSHMLVDGAHGHVFVTGGNSDTAIAVMNADGTADTTIGSEPHASGMALSSDGATLYVARCGQDQIDEIDTTSLANVGHFAADVAGSCSIALANDRLWYGNSSLKLASVSLAAGHAEVATGISNGGGPIASTAVHPDWLVTGSSGGVTLLDVTDPSNVSQLAASAATPQLADVAIAPDGGSLVAALGADSKAVTMSLPSLSTGVTYKVSQANAVAISPAGGKVVVGQGTINGMNVSVFNTGSTAVVNSRLMSQATSLDRGFVAVSANSSFVYSVTPSGTGPYVFHAIQMVPLTTAQFSVKTSAATIAYGSGVTVSVHIGVTTTNRTVQVYRQPTNTSTPVLAATGTVGTGGNYSFVAHPAQDTIYTVRWSGDDSHLPVTSGTHVVNVRLVMHRQTKGGYKTASGIRLYHYAASCGGAAHTGCPTFLAWASPLQPARTISYVVQGKTTKGNWVTILKGGFKTASGGKLTLIITYQGKSLVGVNQRVRFSMVTNNDFVGQTSSWLPFRITT